MKRPRIALIHATSVAIDPIREALERSWPQAEVMNLLDDALSIDRAKDSGLSADLAVRIIDLAFYAKRAGADGILFTCSAFGPAIETAARNLSIPVLKPNEAMFQAAFRYGSRIGMIATFPPAVEGMESEFAAEARHHSPIPSLHTVVAAGAMTELRSGNVEGHNTLVASHAAELGEVDAIMLAHFSTSRAAAAVRAVTRIPVLTAPDAAVEKVRLAVR
jgi:Asp/Glu/hydantoin racemase